MRKFLSFLTIIAITFSCSNDDSTEQELPINKDIYLFKKNYYNYEEQVSLVKYDIDSSTETIVYSLGNDFDQNDSFNSFNFIYSIYHPTKNEIITLDSFNNTLLRVNLSNGSETTNILSASQYTNYKGLILNNIGDLYLFKVNYDNNEKQVSLVKYDIDSSTETIVYSLGNDFDQNDSFAFYNVINSIYHPTKNEIITLDTFNNTLLRVNLSNGSETTNILSAIQYANYNGLILNNIGDLYLFKLTYANNEKQVSLVKYDIDSSTETIVYSLGNNFDQNNSINSYIGINAIFNSTKNEIITLDTYNNTLLRVNLSNGSETTNILSGQYENYYGLILKGN